jgi:hypothetical protein
MSWELYFDETGRELTRALPNRPYAETKQLIDTLVQAQSEWVSHLCYCHKRHEVLDGSHLCARERELYTDYVDARAALRA